MSGINRGFEPFQNMANPACTAAEAEQALLEEYYAAERYEAEYGGNVLAQKPMVDLRKALLVGHEGTVNQVELRRAS